MNRDQEFDQLARTKLQDRSFPFEESSWLLAKVEIEAQLAQRRKKRWSIFTGAALLIATLLWVFIDQYAVSSVHLIQHTIVQPKLAPSARVDSIEPLANQVHSSPSSAPSNLPTEENAVDQKQATRVPSEHSNVNRIAEISVPSKSEVRTLKNHLTHSSSAIPREISIDQDEKMSVHANSMETTSFDLLEPKARATSYSSQPVATAPLTKHTVSSDEAIVSSPALDERNDPIAVAYDSTASANQFVQAEVQEIADSTSVSPVFPISHAMPPKRSLDLSILGGYSSSISAIETTLPGDWQNQVSRIQSFDAGTELMYMGKLFGVGVGIHYSTYGERINVEALDQTSTIVRDFWFLQAVNVNVLSITDTIETGQEPVYVGQSEPTTIYTIAEGSEITTTTGRVREARTVFNRTSFIELPLLCDFHVTSNKWTIGIRGGLVLGMLTQRKGELPGLTEGYTTFEEQAFREWMTGYTARIYLRYPLSSGWSLGLEPVVRGQFQNSLKGGSIERISSSYGAMLSLTYRLN